MKTFVAFLRSFGKPYTYDVRRNSYLWLGVFWGLLIPSFVYACDVNLSEPGGPRPLGAFWAHPSRIVLLIQPGLLGILFGAMGSVRHDLEAENERLIETLKDPAIAPPRFCWSSGRLKPFAKRPDSDSAPGSDAGRRRPKRRRSWWPRLIRRSGFRRRRVMNPGLSPGSRSLARTESEPAPRRSSTG